MSSSKEQIDNSPPTRRGRSRAVVESTVQPGVSVNMDELRELIALLLDNGLAELELERENFRVHLRREGAFANDVPTAETALPTNSPPANKPVTQPGTAAVSSPAHPGAHAETAALEDQGL